ncbi:MAG: hypothetical protein QM831_44345 [Kofleriaceae bacterium]
MSARLAWTLIAGSVVVTTVAAARQPDRSGKPAAPPQHAKERPWLSADAIHELVTHDGGLGPLFADLSLGGPAPSPEQRARIADFARKNDVEIYLDATADELKAIRLGITFGGCCGYEGADTFARSRLARPKSNTDCSGHSRGEWVDDWVADPQDGTTLRGRVRVNRVDVRWEAALTTPELLDRAEALVGKPRGTSDRWIEIEPNHKFIYEVPTQFVHFYEWVDPSIGDFRDDLGLHVTAAAGKVTEVSFKLDKVDGDELAKTLRARWGEPVKHGDNGMEFHSHGHTITALVDWNAQIAIR